MTKKYTPNEKEKYMKKMIS